VDQAKQEYWPHHLIMKIVCHTFAAFLLFVMPSEAAPVQQSSGPPAQQRTGRSYNSRDPAKKPPPAVPQAPSPVTFTDVT
jgi:hypothetical protein